ncbi:MAG TPA: hypothetical protein VJ716_05870 [Gaiellaceae bacterium]|nr:hypothetical protein [Gaiellaceae bacterium]
MSDAWRNWILHSEGAVRASRAVRAIAALGLAVAATIVLANLGRGRSVPGVTVLLFLGIPALVVGQLWGIAVLVARQEGSPEAGWLRARWRFKPVGGSRRFFFGSLPSWMANAILVVFFLGWLSAMTAFPSLLSGNPTSPAPGCRYRLDNHGEYSCVSRSTWLAAGAAEQRFVAGVLGAFFVFHLGLAAAELRRRRDPSVTPEPAA